MSTPAPIDDERQPFVEISEEVAASLDLMNQVTHQHMLGSIELVAEIVKLIEAAGNSKSGAQAAAAKVDQLASSGDASEAEQLTETTSNILAEAAKASANHPPSPAIILGHTAAHAIGSAYENTVQTQNQVNIVTQAAVTEGINLLYQTAVGAGKGVK